MMFTSIVQIKVVDVYVAMTKRNQSKIYWAIFIQALFSYFVAIIIAAMGVYIVPDLSDLIKSPLALSSLFQSLGVKVTWNLLMVLVCIANFMYQFNMIRQIIVYILDSFKKLFHAPIDDSSVPPESKNVEISEETHWLISIGLQLVLITFTVAFIRSRFNVETSAGGIFVLLAPLIFTIMPILLHTDYLKSRRLMTIMIVTMLVWAWMVVTIALSLLGDTSKPTTKPSTILK